jgi:hypothetical protein
MSRLFIRRFVSVVIFGAFLGIGAARATPVGQMGMTAAMADSGQTSMPTPCKAPGPCKDAGRLCDVATGCVVSPGLPADASQSTVIQLSWSKVPYWTSSDLISGLSPEPDIGPPIQVS